MKLIKQAVLCLLFSAVCFAQSHSVTLNWVWSQGSGPTATGFNIYSSATATPGSFVVIASTPTIGYVDTSAAVQTSGAVRYYYVTAFNANGESTPSNTVTVTIPFVLAPATGLTATAK